MFETVKVLLTYVTQINTVDKDMYKAGEWSYGRRLFYLINDPNYYSVISSDLLMVCLLYPSNHTQ